jgi:MoaA/NifB/PqqE/SkfB family radical SAM enzyme
VGKYGRFLHLGRIFWNYRVARRTDLPHPPLRLWIESTNACNLRCVMCPTSLPEAPPRGFMDFALYARLVDEAAAFAYDANLHHRGEALLHPELPRMIRYAHERGLRTMVHTNGTLLDAGKAREILAAGLDYLSFSFDGFEPETYERIRVRASFDRTVGNIEGFLREKQATGSRSPYTVIEVINFPGSGNVDRAARESFLKRFAGLPLDEVRIKEPHNWAGSVPEHAGADARPFVPCTFPWFALVVLWDGTVVACPQDFYGTYPVGDARARRLLEIWNDEPLRRLRADMLAQQVGGYQACAGCDSIRRPTFLGVPSPNLQRFLGETIVGYARKARGLVVEKG